MRLLVMQGSEPPKTERSRLEESILAGDKFGECLDAIEQAWPEALEDHRFQRLREFIRA